MGPKPHGAFTCSPSQAYKNYEQPTFIFTSHKYSGVNPLQPRSTVLDYKLYIHALESLYSVSPTFDYRLSSSDFITIETNMSFGWSVSDVLSAVKFLHSLRTALKESGGAAETYRQDSLYLSNVSSVLEKVVSAVNHGPLQEPLEHGVREITVHIENMGTTLEKYRSSLVNSRSGIGFFVRRSSRKVQYGLFLSGEVQELRKRISEQLQVTQLELDLLNLTTGAHVETHVAEISTDLNNVASSLGTKLDEQNSQLTAAQREDLFRKTLAWLNPMMAFEDKHTACLKDILDGSCDWIFSKQAYMNWYQTIAASHPTLLWVTGIPGAGKTTVASRVIQSLLQRHQVAYFYCETRAERSRTTTGILCTLSWQILRHDSNLLECMKEIYSLGAEPYAGGMRKALYKLMQAKPETLIVLDGLDECDAFTRREMCDFLVWLTEKANVIVFSRDLVDINEGLLKGSTCQRLIRLEMAESDTETEIKRFIIREIESLPEMDEGSKRQIAISLQRKAQGMFLWADLMIKQLRKGWFDVEDCLEAIEQMPNDLSELYSLILRKLHGEASEQERRQSKAILSWLACAQRALKLLELVVGVKMQDRLDESVMRNAKIFSSSELKKVINRRCGPLVRFVENANDVVVTLVHATTKDFLLSYHGCDQPFKELLVNARVAHTLISRSCLTYMSYDNIDFCPFDVTWADGQCRETWDVMDIRTRTHLQRYQLLDYAAVHWADHFDLSDHGHDISQSLRRLYSSEIRSVKWLQVFLRLQGDKGAFRTSPALGYLDLLKSFSKRLPISAAEFDKWLYHLSGPTDARFQRWERFMSSGNANDFLLPLHIAAFFDFGPFVQQELQNGADVNQRTVDGQTALHLAARGEAMVSGQLLTKHGADVNALGWSANTPLSWAVDVECYTSCTRSGPFLMAKHLLSCGADTDLVYDSLPPLNRACDMPMPDDPYLLEIIHSLLEDGAARQINGHPRHRSPLASAAAEGAPELVKLLLDFGACPDGGSEGNAFQRMLRNPLLTAIRGSQNDKVILALLEGGANPNIAGPDARTALHVCIKECEEPQELADLLIRFGADVNSLASDNSLPLHEAVAENKLDAIRFLLQKGSSLNVEDVTGRTPLMFAVENNQQDAICCLCKAGAALSGADWQLCPNSLGVLEPRWHEPTYTPERFQHILETYWILRYRGLRTRPAKEVLPRHLALRILEEARYWLKAKSSNTRREEYDDQRAALNIPYILSAPLPATVQHTVREVIIATCSHDQGWSNFKQYQGTYEGSNTWFELAVLQANGEWLDLGGDGFICRNIHASDKSRKHYTVFAKRSLGTPCRWIDLLKPGDRIGVIPKAYFSSWVNHVQSISIEIFHGIAAVS